MSQYTVIIATRHDIGSINDVNKELEDSIDTCGTGLLVFHRSRYFDDQMRGKFALVIRRYLLATTASDKAQTKPTAVSLR